MKKRIVYYLLGCVCLFMMACNHEPKQPMTIDEVHDSWQGITIKCAKNADIKGLVEAFQKQWPTNSVMELMKEIELPEDQQQYLSNYEPNHGYMSFAEGSDDASSESMEARVWKRENGHQLFAISFDQPSSSVKSFVAFFDYDPSKGVMVPETDKADFFEPSFSNAIVGYHLPEEGDDIVVNEYFMNWWMSLRHVYTWDGMNHNGPNTYFEELPAVMDRFDEDYMTYEMGDFSKYSLIDVDEDGEPELWISTDDEEYQAVLSIVQGSVKLIAGADFKRHLMFYKGVVGDAGGCGTGCFYAKYTKLKNSAPEFVFDDMQNYNFEKDDMDDEYAKDGEPLTLEEGWAILESFGEAIEPEVRWRPLAIQDY